MNKPLTFHRVEPLLQTAMMGRTYEYAPTMPSTNLRAKEMARRGPEHTPEGAVVVADGQTLGRGRRGRSWHSPKGLGVWMSVILRPDADVSDAPKVALLSALAVARGLEDVTGTVVDVEWPNDIVIDGKKVGGILVEMELDGGAIDYIVTGIGINVNIPQQTWPDDMRQRATSLAVATKHEVDRAVVLASILNRLEPYYVRWNQDGFQPILQSLREKCVSVGRPVSVTDASGTWVGDGIDIAPDGALLVRRQGGALEPVYSADVSVRHPV